MSTIQLKNTKSTRYDYSDLFKTLAKAYPEVKFSPEQIAEAKTLTPSDSASFDYELHNINTSLANGWRRVIIDEIEFPRFNCGLSDIKSTDAFCAKMTDYVKDRIHLIPTQFLPKPSKTDKSVLNLETKGGKPNLETFTISVKNNTSKRLEVTSADIKSTSDSKFEWNRNMGIIEIRPGCTFDVALTLEWGINLKHGSYSKLGPVRYRALGFPDYPAAASVVVTSYALGITTCSLVDPKAVTVQAWQTLRNKMVAVSGMLGEVKAVPHNTPALKVSTIRGDRIQYEFMNETCTVTNILAWYGYKLDPTISFIAAGDNHIEDQSRVVNITHPEHTKLLHKAADNAVADITAILKLLA